MTSYLPFAELFDVPLRNGLTKPKVVRGDGMKMVNMGEVFANTRIRDLTMDRVPMLPRERESSILRNGDLLFARQSLVLSGAGKCCLFQGDSEEVTFESHIIRCRLDASKADSGFYFYLFQSPKGRSLIETIVEQVAAAGIRGSDLARLLVPVPPLPTQRTIAHVLGALDDLIELNRETNEILEEMARALFKSWFVDFDPVRAKLEGRPPAGMDAATAALFPDHFQDSELGQIPKGWEVKPLSQNIELLSGGTPKTSEPSYWDGDIPWYSVRDAPSDADVWVVGTEKRVTPSGIANSAAKILPEKTTIISARGTVGKLALIGRPMAINQSCYGVRGAAGYGQLFTYYSIKEAVEELQQNAHGSVFDTITRETFTSLRVASPPPGIAESFERMVEPLLDTVLASVCESRDLATLRDTLLPKLLSGEVSVSNLEPCAP